MTLMEQLANVGSEVERAINWKSKNNAEYSQKAFFRALELISFTIEDKRHLSRLKELVRLRETLVDFFAGANEYGSANHSMKAYFLHFTYASRRDK
jgi:ABC-type antimicrobial peptide transport system ATPase subunit